jgi:hypothetical protein
MIISSYPVAYQSAFRAASFVLAEVDALEGLDVEILPATDDEPLGVKRIWGEGEFAVNVAPYVRSLLSPGPLCDRSLGLISEQGRYVGCRVSAVGVTSQVVYLTAGTTDAPTDTILSAAPAYVTIHRGEKDEISVIVESGSLKPSISFVWEGTQYTDNSFLVTIGSGMRNFVVDEDAIAHRFANLTGVAKENMQQFTVTLKISVGGSNTDLSRHYTVDKTPHGGVRLAWVNRYGAIDYYTFPFIESRTLSGTKGRILSTEGWQTVTSEAQEWTTLTSEYEQADTLEWLAELLSSPKVWRVEGNVATQMDVANGEVSWNFTAPGNITIKVRPSITTFSRKL